MTCGKTTTLSKRISLIIYILVSELILIMKQTVEAFLWNNLIRLAIYYETSLDYLANLTDNKKPYPHGKHAPKK